jgi:hypothetical protein
MRAVGFAVPIVLTLGLPTSARADIVSLTVSGNQATGVVALPGGIGATLTLTFEQVVGLTPASLQAEVTLVDPLDLSLLARLPDLISLSVPLAFPLLIQIEPPASSALTFSGVVDVSLHTENLDLDLGLPLSMFAAPLGGPFSDFTTWEEEGSYRGGATRPAFSQFLVLVDLRPIDLVISGKFDRLQSDLTQHGATMPAAVRSDLQLRLNRARTFYQLGLLSASILEMSGFEGAVKAHSGAEIPDVWRANDALVNVAGILRSDAATLKFSLNRKAAH